MKDYKEDPEKGCRWHFKPDGECREEGPNDVMMHNFLQYLNVTIAVNGLQGFTKNIELDVAPHVTFRY